MLQIEYPEYDFRIKEENSSTFIFDGVRRKWVTLTPEEWVRQNFIQYLIQVKNYPSAVIAVEKEIKSGELKKRCDIVVYKSDVPWVIIECKEPGVVLNDAVIEQILAYNITLQVKILVITNGENNYAIEIHDEGISSLNVLPKWNE